MPRRKTQEQFEKDIFDINPNIIVTSSYINNYTKVGFKCKVCGYEWETEPKSITYNKTSCRKCIGHVLLTQEEFEERLKKVNSDITVIGKYTGYNNKIRVKCNIDGREWDAFPQRLLKGVGCLECMERKFHEERAFTLEQFKEKMKELAPSLEILSTSYTNLRDRIKYKCKVCRYEGEALGTTLLTKGNRCPQCTASSGEKIVRDWLETNKINLDYQKIFDDCKDKRALPFDFYLPDKNILIEYDGKQHFKPATFGGISKERAEYNFNENKRRDKIKDEYCKEKGIELIRIPYTKKTKIPQILKEKIL